MILRTGQKRNLIVAINAIVDLNAQMWGQYIAIQKITGTSIPLREIEKIISEKPELGDLLDSRLPYSKAEIIWICRNEMPFSIEDVLARRIRSLLLNARVSIKVAPEVARLMADELGHDTNWQEAQVKSYNQLINNYI